MMNTNRRIVGAVSLAVVMAVLLWSSVRPVNDDSSSSTVVTPLPTKTMVDSRETSRTPTPSVPRGVRLLDDDTDIEEDSELLDANAASPVAYTPVFSRPTPSGRAVVTPMPAGDDDDLLVEPGVSAGVDLRAIFEPLDERRVGGSGLISGVRVRTGGGATVEPTEAPVPDEDDPESGLPWVGGQARGYTALYAMHPRARPVVEQHVKALLESRIRDPYIGILVDGTFSKDYAYARSLVSRLSVDGRRLTVALYLSNGSTQRRWNTTRIKALFNTVNPRRFRDLIKFDDRTREQFRAVAAEARSLFEFNASAGSANRNIAVVMLEDNLDSSAYGAMRELAREELGGLVRFIRNPCVGCFSGNDRDSLGDSREEHAIELFDSLARGDAYSLDGEGFSYPNEASGDTLTYEEARALMERAASRQLQHIALWRFSWQGLAPGQQRLHPDERNYVPSTDEQVERDIELLRLGLLEE